MAGIAADPRRLTPFSRFRTTSSSSLRLRSYSTQPPRGSNNAIKFWPFLAIIGIGTAGYVFMIKARADSKHAPVRRLQ
ncbi:hypothetical protein GGR54DRAFT_272164 [Hypoxylon sp. NC1633]|nr:hypothetical protein GGR54DRAFT_272164 [Hypoxylon sp. NC1633]